MENQEFVEIAHDDDCICWLAKQQWLNSISTSAHDEFGCHHFAYPLTSSKNKNECDRFDICKNRNDTLVLRELSVSWFVSP